MVNKVFVFLFDLKTYAKVIGIFILTVCCHTKYSNKNVRPKLINKFIIIIFKALHQKLYGKLL